jgi:NAD+ kinase
MTSTTGSTQQSPRAVETAAVVSHGRVDVHEAVARVETVAAAAGVTLLAEDADPRGADIAIALGGDGTLLRTLAKLLGSPVPVIGVNYGRVGFLASIEPDGLERDLARVFAGEYVVVELPTLEVQLDGDTHLAVNDVVATSAMLGRMVELSWAVGGEDLGTIPCDGLICATPSGSTAYNLSNGGPVLVRGLDAMAVTFIAPHSLHARPLVVPRGPDLTLVNRTADVEVAVLVDGRRVAGVAAGGKVTVRLSPEKSMLATLPETTFFGRYRDTFTSHP